MENVECNACHYCFETEVYSEENELINQYFECRRYPPVIDFNALQEIEENEDTMLGIFVTSRFPIIEPNMDWCGEFRPAARFLKIVDTSKEN